MILIRAVLGLLLVFVQADHSIAQPIDNLDSLANLAEVHQVVMALRKVFNTFVNNNSAAENAKYDFDSVGFCRKRILNASKKPWDSSIKTSRMQKYKFILATAATAKCVILADSGSFLYNAGRQSLRAAKEMKWRGSNSRTIARQLVGLSSRVSRLVFFSWFRTFARVGRVVLGSAITYINL